MQRLAIATICVALCALALPGVRHAPAQQHDQTATSYAAKLKALQKERIAILSRNIEILLVQYKAGTADFRNLLRQRRNCSMPNWIARTHRKSESPILKRATRWQKPRWRLWKRGSNAYKETELDVNRFKAVYLDMQIKLLKERQKLASGKGG